MRLTDECYEFIRGEVVFLFERYDVRCIPINGFELAYKMGIKLIPYSALSEEQRTAAMRVSSDGLYAETKDGQDVIYFNDIGVSYERMNMTILHEIGHCVLDHTGHSDEEEAEAAFFAKYAAAPPPLVHRVKPNCPEEIADAFDLSYEAACYAYEYYLKWLQYGGKEYTEYEVRLLQLFEAS
ncbi:MAG: ImmA/IrrE family metallo-endopeptidase [Oscillospiraceae bacterium]|nr:ImmA/IrrE family metallo-endopeptidase [Oscillospiraceae bacterium]